MVQEKFRQLWKRCPKQAVIVHPGSSGCTIPAHFCIFTPLMANEQKAADDDQTIAFLSNSILPVRCSALDQTRRRVISFFSYTSRKLIGNPNWMPDRCQGTSMTI
jgi:hypothetical protein